MKNNPFTHEEINLMSIYNADGTREGLIAALTEMWGYLDAEEAELRELTDSALAKLRGITDAEYAALDLTPDFDLGAKLTVLRSRAGKIADSPLGARRMRNVSSGAFLFENRRFSQVMSRRKYPKIAPASRRRRRKAIYENRTDKSAENHGDHL